MCNTTPQHNTTHRPHTFTHTSTTPPTIALQSFSTIYTPHSLPNHTEPPKSPQLNNLPCHATPLHSTPRHTNHPHPVSQQPTLISHKPPKPEPTRQDPHFQSNPHSLPPPSTRLTHPISISIKGNSLPCLLFLYTFNCLIASRLILRPSQPMCCVCASA